MASVTGSENFRARGYNPGMTFEWMSAADKMFRGLVVGGLATLVLIVASLTLQPKTVVLPDPVHPVPLVCSCQPVYQQGAK